MYDTSSALARASYVTVCILHLNNILRGPYSAKIGCLRLWIPPQCIDARIDAGVASILLVALRRRIAGGRIDALPAFIILNSRLFMVTPSGQLLGGLGNSRATFLSDEFSSSMVA